jgi:UDP-N-acetylmuramoyl-L-alanyl-D-glutamate--2,6-diaminopimelate ligase
LSQLCPPDLAPPPGPDPEIGAISVDSRRVAPGDLFAAMPGANHDGIEFVGEALARGAAALLVRRGARVPAGIPIVESDNPRLALARMAARYHGRQPRQIVAVTGTNGKTSVVNFARQLWTLRGHRAASLGTLGLIAPARARAGSLTTPDPIALHADLAALAAEGVEHVAMEASSHGLSQYRLDGVRIAAAAFTNLSRDHLDYHATMEAYFAAKRRLFDTLLATGGTAVLNADVPEAGALDALCRARGHRVLRYGRAGGEITILSVEPFDAGQRLRLKVLGQDFAVTLRLVGSFQAMNALAALGLLLADDEAAAVTPLLEKLEPVPGRMQHVATRARGGAVYVDYAHTPDALETVLNALRPHAGRCLGVVFGCGGDRDAGKRPQMGAIATRLADRVIVTDDNPRTEDAASIRRQIMASAPGAREIGARREAIETAVAELRAGDVLVLAGKGHETGQIVGAIVHPFDDAMVAREAVARADAGPT